MKKILFISALLISLVADAQFQNIPGTNRLNTLRARGSLQTDSGFRPPRGPKYTSPDTALVYFDIMDTSWHAHMGGGVWVRVGSGPGGGLSGGVSGKFPFWNSSTTLGNSPLTYDGSVITTSKVIKYISVDPATYDDSTLVPKWYLDLAIAGISAGGTSDMVNTTIAALDASSGWNTAKSYFVTDVGKMGIFRYAGIAANQSGDNAGGTVIVTSDLRIYRRVYEDGINADWFGATADGTTSSSLGTADQTAINNALAASGFGERVYAGGIGGGNYYVSGSVLLSNSENSTPGRYNLEIKQTVYAAVGIDAFILEGSMPRLNLGNVFGLNSNKTDSAGYAANTGNAIYLRNCQNAKDISFNKITNFYAAVKCGGSSTTTPRGSQYNRVYGAYARSNYTSVWVTSTGTTDGTQVGDLGNWSNSNEFTILESGFPGRGTAGTFAVLVKKEANSNQSHTSPFNFNKYNIGVEGAYIAFYAENEEHSVYNPLRLEFPQIANGVYWRADNTGGLGCFNNHMTGSAINENFIMPGGAGNSCDFPPIIDAQGQRISDLTLTRSGGIMYLGGGKPFSRYSTTPAVYFSFNGQNILNTRYFAYKYDPTYNVDFYVPYELNDTTVTGNYSVGATVGTVLVNSTGSVTITLPAASSYRRRDIKVKNINTGTVTIAGLATGSKNILSAYEGTTVTDRGGIDWQNVNQTSTTPSTSGIVTTAASAYTVGATETLILCTATGAGFQAVNLPSAASYPNRIITIASRATGKAVSIAGGDPIGNNVTGTTPSAITYQSSGTNWIISGRAD